MIRFDYLEQTDGSFHITVVSENGDTHSLVGRLVLSAEEWKRLWIALLAVPIEDPSRFFKFENKNDFVKASSTIVAEITNKGPIKEN